MSLHRGRSTCHTDQAFVAIAIIIIVVSSKAVKVHIAVRRRRLFVRCMTKKQSKRLLLALVTVSLRLDDVVPRSARQHRG